MKILQTKKDIQADLDRQVRRFLSRGGDIDQITRGQSGLAHDKPWINPFKSGDQEKAVSRTPVPDVVAAIEARKHPHKKTIIKNRRPKKKWILDDFGEPLRWVWSEDSE